MFKILVNKKYYVWKCEDDGSGGLLVRYTKNEPTALQMEEQEARELAEALKECKKYVRIKKVK